MRKGHFKLIVRNLGSCEHNRHSKERAKRMMTTVGRSYEARKARRKNIRWISSTERI